MPTLFHPRPLLVSLVAGSLGLVAGAGGMLVAFPFLFPPAAINEPAPGAQPVATPAALTPAALAKAGTARTTGPRPAATVVRLGGFMFDRDAPGRDPLHWANGSGSVYRDGDRLTLRLERDFEAGAGPNFVVYLNTVPVGEERAFLADKGRVAVGKLRSFTGAQNYVLPAGADLRRLRTVTIWCETFGVYIGSATLPVAA